MTKLFNTDHEKRLQHLEKQLNECKKGIELSDAAIMRASALVLADAEKYTVSSRLGG